MASRSGSSAACMPTATASRATIYRAFEYFQKFADSHADDNPAMPRARFVANAFVALGHYYLDGIPNSSVTASPERARRMFAHAASYFGDPEAQYQLAKLYLDGNGVARDAEAGGSLAGARRQQGSLPVAGACSAASCSTASTACASGASGLMWLTIACDGPGAKVHWIAELRETAFQQASDDERALALILLRALGRRPARVARRRRPR